MFTSRKPTGLRETINVTNQFQRNIIKSRGEKKRRQLHKACRKVAYDEGTYF